MQGTPMRFVKFGNDNVVDRSTAIHRDTKHMFTALTTALPLIATAIIMLALPWNANAQTYEEGVHYATLSKPQPVATGDKIEVRELFWYGCPHCYEFEPYIQRWQQNKPENAEYVPMPAVFRQQWEFHARSFHTFEALGIVEKVHVAFFDAIHKDRKNFESLEHLTEFTDKFDVDASLVRETFDSFAVETKIRQGQAALPGYEVTGVPAIIVDGKYRTSGSMAGNLDEVLKVIDFLVNKAASER